MKRMLTAGAGLTLAAVILSGCGSAPSAGAARTDATAAASAVAQAATPTPLATAAPTAAAVELSDNTVSAIGEIKAEQTADLSFTVNGTVQRVLVEEGDVVTATQELAQLDMRRFTQSLNSAQASLASAEAAQAALTEAPDKSRVAQAKAQVRQAQITLEQTKNAQAQNTTAVNSQLTAAQTSLESTRNQLSAAKTQAEQSLTQATNGLTQAQTSYATAKKNWDYVQETGNDPTNPTTVNSSGKKVDNKLKDTQRQAYYDAFVKAEAALSSAQSQVQVAQVAYDNARQAEVTGVKQAEEQLTQVQTTVNKQNLPTGVDSVALAQAQVDAAVAGLAQLNPNPTKSQKAQTAASVAQAQAALESAQIDFDSATLRAPFDGVVSAVNIDPGDSSSAGGQAAVTVVDVSKLHVDVNISDVDIAKVKKDQSVKVVVEGAEKDEYTGKVTYIAPTATVSGNVRTYVVRVALDSIDGLRPGMRARTIISVK
ncbi:HlyD family efflux transporter periplasmic adaptor subunit [Chloroflexia bacterium SDU3-3]|nr:HlyD family efflux transporter periplasmic adaptor subunit [Chloroflexia bacterium SDU3-3]